jgi:hypothetical protein
MLIAAVLPRFGTDYGTGGTVSRRRVTHTEGR